MFSRLIMYLFALVLMNECTCSAHKDRQAQWFHSFRKEFKPCRWAQSSSKSTWWTSSPLRDASLSICDCICTGLRQQGQGNSPQFEDSAPWRLPSLDIKEVKWDIHHERARSPGSPFQASCIQYAKNRANEYLGMELEGMGDSQTSVR